MFKWLRGIAEKKVVKSHLSEMVPYLNQLSSCSDEQLANIYLIALTYRNELKKIGSEEIDLFNPQDALERQKFIALDLGQYIRNAQKDSNYQAAAGLKLWLFTIRSVMHDELRPVGISMWHEIQRGIEFASSVADAAASHAFKETGYLFDMTDCGMVPLGFE
jgi:hypothetical protein